MLPLEGGVAGHEMETAQAPAWLRRASMPSGRMVAAVATAGVMLGVSLHTGASTDDLHVSKSDESGGGARPRSGASRLSDFEGAWAQVSESGLGNYLQHLGVGWARRQIALRFSPKQQWSVDGDTLHMQMRNPLGEFKERFPLRGEVRETDLEGRAFRKLTRMTSEGVLEATSRDESRRMTDVVARRWLEHSRGATRMVQETCHEAWCYRRIFERVAQ